MATRPLLSRKTKHITVKVQWLRELVALAVVLLIECPTSLQIADCLTKNQGKTLFLAQRPFALGYALWIPPTPRPDLRRFDNALGGAAPLMSLAAPTSRRRTRQLTLRWLSPSIACGRRQEYYTLCRPPITWGGAPVAHASACCFHSFVFFRFETVICTARTAPFCQNRFFFTGLYFLSLATRIIFYMYCLLYVLYINGSVSFALGTAPRAIMFASWCPGAPRGALE
jgi:hypothetical protein